MTMDDKENAVPEEILRHGSRKPKKPPPVTPKRFTRFFTPRSSISRVTKTTPSKAGRQLREITQQGLNAKSAKFSRSRSPRKTVVFQDIDQLQNAVVTPSMSSKKRKAYLSPESLPFDSSPCKRTCPEENIEECIPSSPPEYVRHNRVLLDRSVSPELRLPPRPIRHISNSNISGETLERSFGGIKITGRGRRRPNCTYWQAHAADFYSRPEDAHLYTGSALPYCTTSCNTNSLIAVGDETGTISIIDTAKDSKHGFSATHLTFQPHANAVMDLAFSSDDTMLATASGDQTSRIIDMHTQRVKYIMHAHSTSVKQVRFQPGNDNVLATSSRDGDIHIWDLRCKGSETLIVETSRPTHVTMASLLTKQYKAFNASPYNSILAAHSSPYPTADEVPSSTRDAAGKDPSTLAVSRNGIVSVTALAFLNSPGRSHLLLSGSEASTTLRLWDIRNRYSRRGPATPLSTTLEPESHSRHRHFGITSLLLNQQGSRIFVLSRDSTVYAYSAAHLINGHAPQLERDFTAKHQRSMADSRKGLGPLYGLRHPKLHASTFYVKAALRPAKDDKVEMLAVGSADGCAVLFPTDESSFPSTEPVLLPSGMNTPLVGPASSPLSTVRPPLRRAASSSLGLSARMRDSIPIYSPGTALIAGHSREVTDVSWTHDGDFVTLSDDHSARLWREGPQARAMRTATDGNSMRAGWGWADVDESWDNDDD
ncbi:uncharacterized protein PV09_05155 [Verruconis gallopava]|uniref:Anaphase-promoting complex subunit 4 WD40 domain-containing protein n=1 Tax=Verruconis gallopava TaxID=253628 RepID=A0A0D1YT94_9PEZI|nr:uncharacterized protein PV09_05155 [Verruconis gallopava]KIW03857.1 hypothetical protein PV09_05155 [Verruconis gallopava]